MSVDLLPRSLFSLCSMQSCFICLSVCLSVRVFDCMFFLCDSEADWSLYQKMPLTGGLLRSRLRKAAIVKLRHLIKTSDHQLSELHHLQQTAQAGGGLCCPFRISFRAFTGDCTLFPWNDELSISRFLWTDIPTSAFQLCTVMCISQISDYNYCMRSRHYVHLCIVQQQTSFLFASSSVIFKGISQSALAVLRNCVAWSCTAGSYDCYT